jgi:hypothetical protein
MLKMKLPNKNTKTITFIHAINDRYSLCGRWYIRNAIQRISTPEELMLAEPNPYDEHT